MRDLTPDTNFRSAKAAIGKMKSNLKRGRNHRDISQIYDAESFITDMEE